MDLWSLSPRLQFTSNSPHQVSQMTDSLLASKRVENDEERGTRKNEDNQDKGSGSTGESNPCPKCPVCGRGFIPPEQEQTFSIQCDRCDSWCHGYCVDMLKAEDAADYELWHCPKCISAGHALVRRRSCSGCPHFARIGSAYCSDACGMSNAEKIRDSWVKTFGSAGDGGDAMDQTDNNSLSSPSPRVVHIWNQVQKAHHQDCSLLVEIQETRAKLHPTFLRLIEWESRVQAIIKSAQSDEESSTARLCGFDPSILLDANPSKDTESPSFVLTISSEDDVDRDSKSMDLDHSELSECQDKKSVFSAIICKVPRKCSRHDGWEKLFISIIQSELDDLYEELQQVASRESVLKTRLKTRIQVFAGSI